MRADLRVKLRAAAEALQRRRETPPPRKTEPPPDLPHHVRTAVEPWLAAFPGAVLRLEPWSEYTPGPYAGADGGRRWVVERTIERYYRDRDAAPPAAPAPEPSRLRAVCGGRPVEIRRDGTRWLLYTGAPLERVRPFATPWLPHAKREAEARYGAATSGWQSVSNNFGPKCSSKAGGEE